MGLILSSIYSIRKALYICTTSVKNNMNGLYKEYCDHVLTLLNLFFYLSKPTNSQERGTCISKFLP